MTSVRLAELGYLLLGVAGIALTVGHRWHPERLCSPLDALRRLQRGRAGRWAVLLWWWWLGWHLFAR